TGDRDYWLNTVKLPLAGDIATGRLTEDEARPIFVAASEACGGAVDSETDWQKFIASDVPNAQALGQAGKRPKTTASVFKDAQAAGWVSPVTPQGDGHGGVQQGAGRKPGVSVPELIDQLAGQPLAFGRNERTGKHTFDLTQPIPGVALPVGVRQIVDDTAGRQIAALLARMTGRDIGVPKAMDAMKTEGDAHPYDPVKEALGALVKNNPWDGTPRLDTWLVTYLGALDTPLHRSWGRLTVLALIARILKPGCKWDHVLTLCGAQGAGKSTLGEIMADLFGPDLFTPMTVLGTDDQKVMEATGGKLVVELSDMSRGRIREVENDKALLSRTFDEARMAYGREVTKQRRGFIFIATTNDDQFLQDVTGNRRWWPVKVGAINLEAFRNDWPQIVVEALQVFFGPEFGGDVTKIGLDPKFYGDAAAAQKAFTSPDELAADVETMLRQKAPDGSWGVRRSTVGGGLRVSHGDLRNRLAGGVWGRLGPNKLGKELNRVMRALGWTAAKAQGDRQWIQPATW
uniref:VapE domain-containing protein n=1 Tax=uncultured Paracoccus sp. TaxID=189685 RepID=UPI0025D952BB